MNATGPRIALRVTSVASLAVIVGCEGCRRDHPFTPFVVDSSSTGATRTASMPQPVPLTAAPAAPTASGAYPIEGERLPPGTRQVRVGARQIDAPQGTVFEATLHGDWNEDGTVDALALHRATQSDAPSVGTIMLYTGGDAKKLADLPGWIPSRSDCTWEPQLRRLGKSTAAVDLHVRCTAAMPSRTATRYLAFLAPMRAEPVLATWRMAESAPDEQFDAVLSGADIDSDGKEDVTLRVALTHMPTQQEVSAEFTWLDRAAGISREPGHFAASLGPVLSGVEKLAASRKTAAEGLDRAAAVWRLLASSCAESATARVFREDGSAMACENLQSSVGRLVTAEVRASLGMGDVLRAAFVMTRAESMFGSRPSSAERTSWRKALLKAVALVEAVEVVTTEVRPVASRSNLRFSPLRFESDGTVLVQTGGGVIRIRADGQEVTQDDASAAPASWPLSVSSSERTLDSVLAACDRSELLVVFKSTTGQLQPPLVSQFLAPRPGVCSGAPSVNWRVSPLSVGDEHLPTVLVEGACISSAGPSACLKPSALGKVPYGSPRSPDGRRLVAQTGAGLLSIGGAKPELWPADRLGGLATPTDCVIDNAGDHIACVQAGTVVLLSKNAAPAR